MGEEGLSQTQRGGESAWGRGYEGRHLQDQGKEDSRDTGTLLCRSHLRSVSMPDTGTSQVEAWQSSDTGQTGAWTHGDGPQYTHLCSGDKQV